MAEIVLTNTGRDAFLEANPEFRGPGAVRAVDAVLGLLALHGADRASGVPEPTPDLARRLLVEDLPSFVWADPAELTVYPAVLRALARRFDEADRTGVEEAVDQAGADFERAMTDPGNLTWPRWYARLLRTEGVDADDPGAVRAWLARLSRVPVPEGARRADLAGRTAVADVLLAEVLTRAYVRDAEQSPAAGPLLADHDVARGIGAVAHALVGRWTAAGLPEGLAGPYAYLAPGPEDLPHLALADALLGEHLDYYGDVAVPLPPPALCFTDSEGLEGLEGSEAPEGEPGEAGNTGGMRTAAEGAADPSAPPAPGADARTERDADLLATAVDALTGTDPDPDAGPYGGEAAHLLYTLYQRGCSAESVARRAAEFEDWTVDPALEDAPVRVPLPGSPAYTTPTAAELARLLGTPGVGDADRARLDGPARALATVVDRLAATGLVFRRGDAFGLGPRGCAAVRHMLAIRGVVVPGPGETDGWDAAPLVAAAAVWPPAAARRVLRDWLRAHGDGDVAWSALLGAIGSVNRGTSDAAATRGLLDVLDLSAAPAGVLRGLLAHPVVGARAEETLRRRGEPVAPGEVPTEARALAVLDTLPGKKGPLESRRTAFDTAAAAWPGGAAALVAAMKAADPHETARVLTPLGVSVS
ncbi:hypothetical protein ABZ990_19640 [Streptomyces sp. NPDC046203]|uniref:hypothetical protein n=1 Tax=Streptomyces sp. NPDC046203 TaxID=3154602 RepID=UPI0033F1AF61